MYRRGEVCQKSNGVHQISEHHNLILTGSERNYEGEYDSQRGLEVAHGKGQYSDANQNDELYGNAGLYHLGDKVCQFACVAYDRFEKQCSPNGVESFHVYALYNECKGIFGNGVLGILFGIKEIHDYRRQDADGQGIVEGKTQNNRENYADRNGGRVDEKAADMSDVFAFGDFCGALVLDIFQKAEVSEYKHDYRQGECQPYEIEYVETAQLGGQNHVCRKGIGKIETVAENHVDSRPLVVGELEFFTQLVDDGAGHEGAARNQQKTYNCGSQKYRGLCASQYLFEMLDHSVKHVISVHEISHDGYEQNGEGHGICQRFFDGGD